MKKIFPLLLVLLFLIACTSPQHDSSTSHEAGDLASMQTKSTRVAPTIQDMQGYYVKSAHDGAWLLFLKHEDSTLKGHLIQYGGMLPPHEFLDSPDAEEDVLQKHQISHLRLDANSKTFSSNLGKGNISAEQVIFEEIIDLEEKLTLVRAASYPYTP